MMAARPQAMASTPGSDSDSAPVATNVIAPTGGTLAYTADTSLQGAKNAANGNVDKVTGLSDAEKQGVQGLH